MLIINRLAIHCQLRIYRLNLTFFARVSHYNSVLAGKPNSPVMVIIHLEQVTFKLLKKKVLKESQRIHVKSVSTVL